MPPYKLALYKKQYNGSLNQLRKCIAENRSGFIDVKLLLPNRVEDVHLQLRCTDAYIIAFKANSGWYHFSDEEKDGWGENCGVKCNYSEVPDEIDVKAVDTLGELAWFPKKAFDRKLIVIAGAVVSESLRFDTVAKLFTALFDHNSVIPLRELLDSHFRRWDKLFQENNPQDKVLLEPPKRANGASSSSG